jgi:ribosomal protein L37AE/L43A
LTKKGRLPLYFLLFQLHIQYRIQKDMADKSEWIPYNEREDQRKTYADRQRAESFDNIIADYGRMEEDARLAAMHQCDVCNMMLVELLPEHRWICTSCGNGISKELIANPEYLESTTRARNLPTADDVVEIPTTSIISPPPPTTANNTVSPSTLTANNKKSTSSRIISKTGQSPDVSTGVAPSSQRKGVLVSKDIHAVGRHGKPFRSNQTDPAGVHYLDRELVQQGYQLKEVRDVSPWTIKSKPLPKGPPVNLDE